MTTEMKEYKYHLELYEKGLTGATSKQKHTCPRCGKKHCFVKYVDDAGDYVADDVGRCDHEKSCGYNKTPREHYETLGITPPPTDPEKVKAYQAKLKRDKEEAARRWANPDYFDIKVLDAQAQFRDNCIFLKWLASVVGADAARRVVELYHVTATRNGRVVFPQIDTDGRLRDAKIMEYTPDGRRIKTDAGDKVTWLHAIMKNRGSRYMITHGQGFSSAACWFGSHLCRDADEIHIVESEKTALFMKAKDPSKTWVATGGDKYLSTKFAPSLKGKNLVIWADCDGVEEWTQRAEKLGAPWVLSPWHTWAGVSGTMDIADYVLKHPTDAEQVADIDYTAAHVTDVQTSTLTPSPDVQTVTDAKQVTDVEQSEDVQTSTLTPLPPVQTVEDVQTSTTSTPTPVQTVTDAKQLAEVQTSTLTDVQTSTPAPAAIRIFGRDVHISKPTILQPYDLFTLFRQIFKSCDEVEGFPFPPTMSNAEYDTLRRLGIAF